MHLLIEFWRDNYIIIFHGSYQEVIDRMNEKKKETNRKYFIVEVSAFTL